MLARSPVGLFGGREVAAEPVDLALQVRGLRGSRWVRRPLEAPVRPVRLLERLRPGALKLHQLSAVDEAAAGEGQQVGLLLPPAAQSAVHSRARRTSWTSSQSMITPQ